MRTFDYRNLPKDLFHRAAGDLNVRVYEDRGKMERLRALEQKALEQLREQARVESVLASARIEGMSLREADVREAVAANAYPEGDAEMAQHVGYARALRVIDSHADELELSSGTIVDLYEQLYCDRAFGARSRYRRGNYLQTVVDGHVEKMLVSPVAAYECPLVLGAACDSLSEAFNAESCSPLVLSAVFTVDLLCIRPFETGNGRVSRLFADLMLRKAGFEVGRYQSIEAIIAERADEYYEALNSCVEGWERGRNDYGPYARFWLGVLHEAHERLFRRVELLEGAGGNKSERVRLFISRAEEPVTKRQVLGAFPDISVSTVENVLGALVREGLVEKRGAGRLTAYVWCG